MKSQRHVTVFIAAVAATWLLAKASGRHGPALARFLLVLQFLLLILILTFSVATRASADPNGLIAGIVAMIAVCAMACQHALLRLANAPATSVMTGNLTNLILSFLDMRAKNNPLMADWSQRLATSLYLLMGFLAGCVSAAVAVYVLHDWSWLLPAGLAAAAIVLR
jgi:uncharacterized membrane protein YoaK (UPF0700 family)